MLVQNDGMVNLERIIVVTCNGRGDLWLHDSVAEAVAHPITQFGDAILREPEDIHRLYKRNQINSLLEKLDDEEFRIEVMQQISDARTQSELDTVYQQFSSRIWLKLHLKSSECPEDPESIIKIVIDDRHKLLKEEKTMTTEDAKPKTEAKPKKEPKPPKYAPDSTIKMKADAEGKAYGKDNNPKRAGSKSHALFEIYKDGMTVESFMKAGGTNAALDWDTSKGFIEVVSAS